MPDSIGATVEKFRSDFGLRPVVATEIEFYLHGSDACATLPAFWDEVRAACAAQHIEIFKIEKERGREQHEIALAPGAPFKAAQDTVSLKSILTEIAAKHTMRADFAAKPFADQPGSGLHVHVHLEDADGKNVFYKLNEVISDPLKFSIGGLLAWLPHSMAIFAPTEDSYKRFVTGSNAPTTVSWGANNRTVAVRLPDSAPHKKRIEHRVAGSDADPLLVVAVILAAMHDGVVCHTEPGPQIYGDASLPDYKLPKLPVLLSQAADLQNNYSKMIAYGIYAKNA